MGNIDPWLSRLPAANILEESMTYTQFCYWLQGAFEITDLNSLTPAQVKIIQNHLNMVFIHEKGATAPAPKAAKPEIEVMC